MPKTWNQKLNIDREPEVGITERKLVGIEPGMKMLIPTPRVVRDYVAALPKGKAVSVDQMKKDLAAQFKADCVCPLTIGIFVRIIAEAAMEDLALGKKESEITPFWRLIAPGDKVTKKVTFDASIIGRKRAEEGISP